MSNLRNIFKEASDQYYIGGACAAGRYNGVLDNRFI